MARKSAHLVVQHVERMPRKILEEHPEVVREYVKGKRGVYALYKGTRLYYVGLASNLRLRLRAHVRDRHAGLWDSFSMYLTEGDQDLRELEALVLRITMPRGNRSKTKFARSQDLRRYFKRKITERQRAELDDLFGSRKPRAYTARGGGPATRQPSLAPYISKRTPIRWPFKGKTLKAIVQTDGTVRFRGRVYNSPSLAASSVTHRAMNGWFSWRYEAAPGRWALLDELRRT